MYFCERYQLELSESDWVDWKILCADCPQRCEGYEKAKELYRQWWQQIYGRK